MNTKEIESLLDRYFEGESTLQEEQLLRDFFQSPEVPDNLKIHQPLFSYFEQASTETMESEINVIPRYPKRNRMIYISSLAAGVLLVIGLFFTFLNDYHRKNQLYRLTPDAQVAYSQTQDALLLLSGNLNNGLKQIQKFESLDKAMLNLQLISKFSQYQPLIINPDEN